MKIIYSNYLFFVIYEWLSIQKSKITKRTQKKDNQQKKYTLLMDHLLDFQQNLFLNLTLIINVKVEA